MILNLVRVELTLQEQQDNIQHLRAQNISLLTEVNS